MKNKVFIKSFTAAVLCVLALCLLASCGRSANKSKTDGNKSEVLDSLPSDLNYDGETVNVFYWGDPFIIWELTSDGSSGDIVEKAVNKRKNVVEERLGVTLNYIEGELPAEVFMPEVRDEIMSGSKDYDIIAGVQCTAGPVAAAGAFRDLRNTKYVDFSKPYWSDDYNTALSVNEKRFMAGGDISLTTVGWSSCMFFDLEQYESIFGSADELYKLIGEGKWTLDVLDDKCRQCYSDLNGNGLKDVGDRFGVSFMGTSFITDGFCFSSGVTYSKRDENNRPVLDVKNEKTLEFVDKFYNFAYNNEGVLHITSSNASSAEDVRGVFEAGILHDMVERRGDEDDFGIIPMPKLNGREEKYHAWISDNTAVYSIPITIDRKRADMASAVLECLASESSRICLPAYYERALKQKYVRDSASAKMIDLIHDGLTTDFVNVYSLSLCEIGTAMRQLIGYGEPNIVSWYDSKAEMVEEKLNELFEAFDAGTGTYK